MRWNPSRSGRAAVAAALAVLAACSQAPDQRVRASGEAASVLLAGGGTLVQDYGAFKVIQASAAALGKLPEGAVTPVDGRILLNAGAFDPGAPAAQAARAVALPEKGRTLGLVQLAGPVRPEWRAALVATGARIVAYIPNDAYLVWGDASALRGLNGLARAGGFVRWAGAYLDADKLDPATRTVDTGAWAIQLVEDAEANAGTLAAVMLVEQKVTRSATRLGYLNLVVHCPASALAALAARPDVVSIQPYAEPTLNDERQAMLVSGHVAGTGLTGPGYLDWLAEKGFTQAQFTASGFGVDVSDSGLDNGTTTPNHFALYVGGDVTGQSRVAYARLEGTPGAGSTIQGCDGHGNLNAHIIGGYVASNAAPHVDGAGYHYGVGIAPFVRVGASVLFDPASFTNPDYEDLQSRAWADGMRISSNSWGAATNSYTADAQRYDALVRDAAPAGAALPAAGNQEMVILFSAGNAGTGGANTVGSPGTAKNVITVGGTEGVQAFAGSDACGIGDTAADSFQDVATFSSRGPTADGRRKPDLVAPATHVSGGVAQAAGQRADPPATAAGAALGCFDGSGVCGGVGSNFFPVSQQWYTASSGTSHSTPAVAGAAALVRQWFLNHGAAAPSPAMTKAYLMSSARYLTGAGANDTLPSNAQGMGFLDLGVAFDDTPRHLVDEDPLYLLTATGQTVVFTGSVVSSSAPVRITLAWTDAPGATSGAAWNNDLDLTVTIGGDTYRGNVFLGPTSTTGGVADTRNNVESVFLPAGTSGPIVITVTAANVVSDGVPNNATAVDQDFALVAYNVVTAPPPSAPTDVTATAPAPNQVEVSWTPTGASQYRVLRATASGGPYGLVGTVTAPPFVDATVSGLVTYYYVVRALEIAESANSNEASATAIGACTLAPVFAGATAVTSAGAATCGTIVSWAPATPVCGGTISYEIYRSTAATFTPGIANRIATGVTGTSFADELNLANGTTYHYVVRATETADRPVTEENAVVRAALVTGAISQDYLDDLDAGRPANAAAYWIASGTAGTLNLTSGCRYQSATTSYRFGSTNPACGGSYPNSASAVLSLGGNGTTPGVDGFLLGSSATLQFRHWFSMESNWDGARLAYSTAGATGPWTKIPDAVTPGQPYITQGGYTGTANSAGGTTVWTGTHAPANGSLETVVVNLDALAGQRVWFAWLFTTDSSVAYEGYYLDDVVLSSRASCTTSVPPPGPAVSFSVVAPASAAAGVATNVTVTATDAVGQAATGYAGTAVVTSSDARAVLPAPVAFTNGAATASVELRTLGAQTVTVADQATPEITGSAPISVSAGPPAALAFSVQPPAATAGAVLSPAVRVRFEDVFGNPTAAADPITVALGANPGNDTLGGTLTVTPTGGVATFPDLVLTRAAAGYTLTASAGSYAGATSSSFTVAPAAPATLDFVQQATTTVAGEPISPAVSVAVRDLYGNVAASTAAVSIALTGGAGGATLSGGSVVPAVDGVASFPTLSVDRVGEGYQLVASSAGLAGGTGTGFGILPAAADRLVYAQGPADLLAGDAFAPAVSVAALDRFGNLATGFLGNVSLSLEVNPGFAPLAGQSAATAVAGVATFPGLSIHRAGSGYVMAASSGTLGRAVSTAFRVSAGPVTQLLFGAEPGAAVAGAALGGPPSVYLADAYGNRQSAASDPITVALGANPGSDTLSGTLTVDAVAGGASFTDLVLHRAAGGYTLVATSGAYTPATSAAFTVSAGAPASLDFVQQASTTVAGASIVPAPSVAIRDAHGNVTSSTAAVSVALAGGAAGAALSGVATVPAVNGVASFQGLAVDLVAQGYRLVASAAGLSGATGTGFGIRPATAERLVFAQAPADLVAGGAFAPALGVAALDRFGNLATGFGGSVTLSLDVNPAAAPLVGSSAATAVNGVATFPGLSIQRAAGGYVLAATSSGLGRATSAAFGVSAGPATQVLFASQPGGAVAGAPLGGPPAVFFADAYGNPQAAATSPVTVSLGANPGSDTLSGTLTVTPSAGVATFPDLVLTRAASGYTLSAGAGALAGATSAPFAVSPGAPAALEFVAAPTAAVAGAPLAPAPAVRVLDAHGNPVPSAATAITVALGANPAAGTLAGPTTAPAAGGAAQFPGLSIDAAGAGYTLAATAPGLTPAATSAFDVAAGAPAALAFLAQPATVRAGAPVGPLTVELRDAHGNRTAATSEVVVGIASSPGTATLGGTRRVAAVDGRATFADLTLDRAGAGYLLSAMVSGLPVAVTAAFDVIPAGAAHLAFTGLPASLDADAIVTVGVVAHDAWDNVAVEYAGTIRFGASDPAALLPADARATGGVASGLRVAFRTRGAQTLTVRDATDDTVRGSATAAVIGPTIVAKETRVEKSGCGCGTANPAELGLLLALGALWRAAGRPRRRAGR